AHLLRRLPEAHGDLQRYIHHVARYGTEDKVRPLVEFARNNGPGDLLRQAALFKAIQQGTQERGGKLRSEARRWAEELAQKLVASERGDYIVAGADLAGVQRMSELQPPLVSLAARHDLPEKHRR